MPQLTWPEIRGKANAFAKDWATVTSERAEAQTFWNEFLAVFGVHRRRTKVVFEKAAERFGKKAKGRIDVFWPGTLLAEHKSAGENLDAAYTQASDYFAGIGDDELPRFIIVSDFKRFRLYDLDDDTRHEFALAELPKNIQHFGFIAGYAKVKLREEPEVNIKAVQRLGELHDALKRNRYGLNPDGRAGHPLQVFLVRLLFCLFADDTGLFSPKDSFLDLIETTRPDGSDTGSLLARLFEVLNTPLHERQSSLVEKFEPFPYVNGQLFAEALPIPEFDADMRQLLLQCCALQWAGISPAIFGAMFQKVIELDARDRRRQLGAHYTSETNILKLIGPLFLDELRAEFDGVRTHKEKLFAFHKKLSTLHFLDPACGCGNFLVITYRELRRLELDVLQAARQFGEPDVTQVFALFKVSLEQFHGIEIEEFPAQVAQVAMWLTQHQMDLLAGAAFGEYFRHLPLEKSAHIRHGNALRLDWEAFVPPVKLNYILGNPPFIGKHYQSAEQKADLNAVAVGMKAVGDLDFVAGWYLKAAQYLTGTKEGFISPGKRDFADVKFSGKHPTTSKHSAETGIEDIFVAAENANATARAKIRCAFVSTNSITQGEQVGVLWSELFRRGMSIRFAHRTFKWNNEAPGKAAVHCVIVGFGKESPPNKRLFEYAEPKAYPVERSVANISPYLTDGPSLIVAKRSKPLQRRPEMRCGNKPTDGGNLLLTPAEMQALLGAEPAAAPFVRRYVGSEEFIHGIERYCLWLEDISPQELHALPKIKERVDRVREFRSASSAGPTRKSAATPTRFFYKSQPTQVYLLIPEVSSERREFVPVGWMTPDIISSNKNYIIAEADMCIFGILQSSMHMSWMRQIAGRLKSDYQYSGSMVYNTFPWPQALDDAQRAAIDAAAQAVLDARAAHAGCTLAQLYDPDTMPPNLVKAHQQLDRAVDAAYRADGGARSYAGDAERVAFLFKRYAQLTSLV